MTWLYIPQYSLSLLREHFCLLFLFPRKRRKERVLPLPKRTGKVGFDFIACPQFLIQGNGAGCPGPCHLPCARTTACVPLSALRKTNPSPSSSLRGPVSCRAPALQELPLPEGGQGPDPWRLNLTPRGSKERATPLIAPSQPLCVLEIHLLVNKRINVCSILEKGCRSAFCNIKTFGGKK